MLINSLIDKDNSSCTLIYDEANHWLRATWRGYIDPDEAMRGAENYLAHAGPFHCACLLNDNATLRGPWFDSIEWLEQVWVPRALELGLRFIAHIVPSDARNDILTVTFPQPVTGRIELQIFYQVGEAEKWLRHCQQRISND